MANPNYILSSDLSNLVEQNIEIISLILNLSSENYESTLYNFLDFFENADKQVLNLIDIVYIFEIAIRIRASKSDLLCHFLKDLESPQFKTDAFNIFEFNHEKLIRQLVSFDRDFKIRPCNMYFLFKSLKASLFTITEIIEKFNEYYQTHKAFYYIHILHFAWFAPEIEQNDQNLFNLYSQSFHKLHDMVKWDPIIEPFYSNFDLMKENDWKSLKMYRDTPESTVFQIMENDSVEYLQKRESMNLNKTFSVNIYNPMLNVSNGNASLFDISAYFASIRCFKYLLLNDVKLSEGEPLTSVAFGRFRLNEHWNSMNFAVAGGCTEIIHLLEHKKAVFNGCLAVSIQFHRYSIFEWLFVNKKDSKNDLFNLIQTCVDSNNVKSLLFILDFMKSADYPLKKFDANFKLDKSFCSEIVSSVFQLKNK